jgi:hypothetical protein
VRIQLTPSNVKNFIRTVDKTILEHATREVYGQNSVELSRFEIPSMGFQWAALFGFVVMYSSASSFEIFHMSIRRRFGIQVSFPWCAAVAQLCY